MTEAEWLTATDVAPMLEFLRGKAGSRQRRLFAIACCHLIRHLIPAGPWQEVLQVAERVADGKASHLDRAAIVNTVFPTPPTGDAPVAWAVVYASYHDASHRNCVGVAAATCRAAPEARLAQAEVLRDIFGNPFRPVAFSPEWRTDTALSLARTMYESREFSAMPILGW